MKMIQNLSKAAKMAVIALFILIPSPEAERFVARPAAFTPVLETVNHISGS